jgi:hypothetical protein
MNPQYAIARELMDAMNMSAAKRLGVLNAVWNDPTVARDRADRQTTIAQMRQVRAYAEGGKVAVVESGMDCDGVQYAGKVSLIDATVAAFLAHWDHTAQWADGPFYLTVMRPSDAERVTYRSRDRAAEAFEDGHAHCLHVGSLDN